MLRCFRHLQLLFGLKSIQIDVLIISIPLNCTLIEIWALSARVALNSTLLLHECLFTLIFIQLLPRRHFLFAAFIGNERAVLHLFFKFHLVVDDAHFLLKFGVAMETVYDSDLLFF